jgi:hypothetical protein
MQTTLPPALGLLNLLDTRHTLTLLALTAAKRSTLFYLLGRTDNPHTLLLVHSAVFYQDQSKRKETRMILFYVCTRCNHNFQDKLVGTEAPATEANPNPPEP